ncbi:MAG: hypothetical protein K8U57_04155 [Planctomycetes bacterium]|nr:hypothetical protein [Planctomycetota bacterium]
MQLNTNRLNRLLSFEDIVEKYGGPPKVWESLRPYLPVWQNHEGQPIYLESQVDDFLRALQHRWSVPTATTAVATVAEQPVTEEFLTIAEAQERFLGGKRSRGWWYKKAKSGKLIAHDAGGSILLKTTDIVRFIDAMQHEHEPEELPPLTRPEDVTASQTAPPAKPSKLRGAADQRSGMKFFRK